MNPVQEGSARPVQCRYPPGSVCRSGAGSCSSVCDEIIDDEGAGSKPHASKGVWIELQAT